MIGNRTGQIAGVKRSATGHELRSKLKDSQAMLKVMAMKLADNLEALPEDQLKELKESVLNAYQELVACDLKTEWMDGALQEALERHKDACAPTPDFQFDTFCETIEGELRRRGDAEGNALDATNTQQYKHLRDTLFPQTDEDADFEVMGEVNREAAYKCPITKTRMVVPMKWYVSQCRSDWFLANRILVTCCALRMCWCFGSRAISAWTSAASTGFRRKASTLC